MIDAIISEPSFWFVGVSFGLLIWLAGKRPSWIALAAVAGWLFSTVALNGYRLFKWEDYQCEPGLSPLECEFAFERLQWAAWGTGYSLTLTLAVGLFLASQIWRPKTGDLLAMLLVLIWIMGEGFTAIGENLNCNFFQIDPDPGGDGSVCDRIYGPWYDRIPLGMQLIAMGLFIGFYPDGKPRALRNWVNRKLGKLF